MIDLAAFAFAALMKLSPPDRHHPPPGWEETPAEIDARYHSIAEDIAAVSRSRRDAAALVGVAWHESGFAKDVDSGDCAQSKGYHGRCDGNRAISIFQLQDGDSERRDLYRTNRRAAAKEALRRINVSLRVCAKNPPTERLAVYAGGVCDLLSVKKAARGLDAAVRKVLAMPFGVEAPKL